FDDVAGVDEAKAELEEVVRFLKEPTASGRLGARLPKGILLVGPPGTGKTLLARAVAGEAGVPFFSISGSEFVEMFVGVGAARVRDLFAQAQKRAPCIVFIDELDALGRARTAGISGIGGHDEKEQTLNQLLAEMDGFDPAKGIVLLGATNRPEILDPALLRAGRFDRQVLVDRPDKVGRAAILRVHVTKVTLDPSVDLDAVAGLTPGFTGADLANLVNEAALAATRRDGDAVTLDDFTVAIERIVAGLEKRSRLMSEKERRVVAHHEMGHALVASALEGTDPVHKISIIPRGVGALGYTMQRPTEDRYLMTRAEMNDRLAVLLGGRAAERLVFDHVSTGAADDLAKAAEIARAMATRYAMVDELGQVAYDTEPKGYLGLPGAHPREYSEQTAHEIDLAVRRIVDDAYARAMSTLSARRPLLEECAARLLERETLAGDELAGLLARARAPGEADGPGDDDGEGAACPTDSSD
ncbi:MAG: ATP-dependent zinc metalloprotease FtsH, partial [Planctomycetota bacterium JB042]